MKKIMIEIPNEFENDLKDKFQDFFERIKVEIGHRINNKDMLLCGNYEFETAEMFLASFKRMQILSNNVTNGDVIKMMFPNAKTWEVTRDDVHCAYVEFKDICEIKSFPLSWWNAPYESEVEQ